MTCRVGKQSARLKIPHVRLRTLSRSDVSLALIARLLVAADSKNQCNHCDEGMALDDALPSSFLV